MRNGACSERMTLGHRTSASGCGYWPTPASRDWKDGSAQSCQNVPVNSLLGRAVHWPTPRKKSETGGGIGLDGGTRAREMLTDAEEKQLFRGGTLSADWTEWLMGWPTGYTDLRPLETDKFQQWLHSHGISCTEKAPAPTGGKEGGNPDEGEV